MIQEIFRILLWVTTIILVISGIDDLFIDLAYWFSRRKYKNSLPKFSEMVTKSEKPIAIMIGAWKEYKVIGRTLTLALNKIKYSNYRIFVGVYPNDLKTVKVVRDIARKDKRVILCLNVNEGPTTKADNLNNLYSCLKEYERRSGTVDIVVIHDSEDFIHPLSLKLFNYFIAYKGFYGIQIPVIPIKSKYGRFFHRTYCDAFAELHSKDLIVRQSLNSFIPFAGTGMGFIRSAFMNLESKEERMKTYETRTKIREEENYVYPAQKKEYNTLNAANNYLTTEDLSDELHIKNNPSYNKQTTFTKKSVPVKHLSLIILIISLIALILIMNTKVSRTTVKNINNDTKTGYESLQNNVSASELTNEVQDFTNNNLTKVSVGYYDDILKVIYIKSDNNNFLVQESSWYDEKKANQRVESLKRYIDNENIRVIKVSDETVTLYRVVTGEYSSLELAQSKAESLRKINIK